MSTITTHDTWTTDGATVEDAEEAAFAILRALARGPKPRHNCEVAGNSTPTWAVLWVRPRYGSRRATSYTLRTQRATVQISDEGYRVYYGPNAVAYLAASATPQDVAEWLREHA